jgi:secreted trypsin-like serine protease
MSHHNITASETRSQRALRRLCSTRLALALICCLGATALLPAAGLGQVSPQVVGGSEPASIAEFPFQVALYDPLADANPANSQFCGGVIIDATHVITAAHCVFDEASGQASSPEEIEVLAGTANLDTEAQPHSGEYVEDPVAITSFDPQWNPATGEHDLGVLTLTRPLWSGSTPALDGTNTIAPVSLLGPTEASYAVPGAEATVSGWGDTHAETLETVRPSYPTKLNDVRLTLVSNGACAKQLELSEPLGPDFVCAGALGKDACYGDSGGPLVVSTGATLPADYRLLGTVDLGFGCAAKGNPGIYQSVVEDENAAFVQSSPPQAPLLGATPPSLSGTAQPGGTLSCAAGSWSGAPTLEFFYGFDSDESTITGFQSSSLTTQLSPSATFAVPAQTATGTRIFCEVGVEDDGGWAEALSPDVTVTSAPRPVPITVPATPLPTTALPTLRVISKSCQKDGRCTVNVIASAGSGQAAVAKIGATVKNVPCAKHAKHDICARPPAHAPSVKSMPARHFSISTRGLSPGKYTLSLTAVDLAGIRQETPTRVSLTVASSRKKTRGSA